MILREIKRKLTIAAWQLYATGGGCGLAHLLSRITLLQLVTARCSSATVRQLIVIGDDHGLEECVGFENGASSKGAVELQHFQIFMRILLSIVVS